MNHLYVYAVDADFGPFFLKFCSYFRYNAKLCINGNEWAKRQATKAGLDCTALDNGFAACEDPARFQKICNRLTAATIDAQRVCGAERIPVTPSFAADDWRAAAGGEVLITLSGMPVQRVRVGNSPRPRPVVRWQGLVDKGQAGYLSCQRLSVAMPAGA